MLAPSKTINIPHDAPHIEKDIEVCEWCYDRIQEALVNDMLFRCSVVGSRILGVHTSPLEAEDISVSEEEPKG